MTEVAAPDPPVLEFSYAEVAREIDAIRHLAGPMLDPLGESALRAMADNLAATKDARHFVPWRSQDGLPLRTRPSQNYVRRDGHKGPKIIGQLEFTWTLLPSGANFAVAGNASIRLRILSETGERELGMWRMEMGTQGAPGCFFHAQILGEKPSGPFSSALPVPRLPTHILTPASALEFMLAEIFQGEWPITVARLQSFAGQFAAIQHRRWKRWLDWQINEIDQAEKRKAPALTPWSAVKAAMPPADLLVHRDPPTRRRGR